jgi:hypothetical protein
VGAFPKNRITLKLEQLLNAAEPTAVTVAGIVMLVKFVTFRNA